MVCDMSQRLRSTVFLLVPLAPTTPVNGLLYEPTTSVTALYGETQFIFFLQVPMTLVDGLPTYTPRTKDFSQWSSYMSQRLRSLLRVERLNSLSYPCQRLRSLPFFLHQQVQSLLRMENIKFYDRPSVLSRHSASGTTSPYDIITRHPHTTSSYSDNLQYREDQDTWSPALKSIVPLVEFIG